MNVLATRLDGVLIIEPAIFRDERGFFMECYSKERYRAAGIPDQFVQDNVSLSYRGVLRGLHFQHPHAQAKLVQVLRGEVFDVAVDLRAGSPTFSQWIGEYLSQQNGRQMYIPPGFAHGFLVTADEALFSYKCTDSHRPEAERSIRWDDPQIGIVWPMQRVSLSAKDRGAPRLDQNVAERLPTYQPR